MGGITLELELFVQTMLDIIMIKTGFVLSEAELCDIVNKEYAEDSPFLNYERDKSKKKRIRSETFDEIVLTVRKKLGEVERTFPDIKGHMERLLSFESDEIDPISVSYQVHSIMTTNSKDGFYDRDKVISESKHLGPEELILEILDSTHEMRKLSNRIVPLERILWDGGHSVEDLFEKELIPKYEDLYLDQKFINYLAANPERVEFMHWRNFERLTAEFFNRYGFKVVLGPGTNDGGVDVRIYKDEKESPFIIIQCKRHKESNEVKVNTVKALYSDVDYEKAEFGLIATTSKVAPVGKKVVSIRKYPIGFAESKEVIDWITKLKENKY